MYKLRKKVAAGAVLFLLFQGIFGGLPGGLGLFAGDGGGDGIGTVPVYAADPTPPATVTPPATGTPTPTPTPTPTSAPPATGTPAPTPTVEPTQAPPAPTISNDPWWGEGQQPEFFMIKESQPIKNGQLIPIEKETTVISIGNSAGVFPSGATIQWETYNKKVISLVEKQEGTKYTVEVKAVGPGYTSLGAIVSYGGKDYPVNCQLHVPLALMTSTGNVNTGTSGADEANKYLGMIDSLKWGETAEAKTIQLKLEDPAYSHYLPMFQYVNYGAGVTSFIIKENVNNGVLIADDQMPAWEWTSSDTNVVTVDQYGYIKAVGAGYAEVTVTTLTTADNAKKDSKTIGVLVEPAIRLPGGTQFLSGVQKYTASSTSMTLHTNAVIADGLEWALYRGTADKLSKAEPLDLDENRYMQVNISDFGNGVTLSEMKAGIYCLIARPTDKYEENNPKIRKVVLEITVPLMISENPVVMNVGDIYSVLSNANVLDKTLFTYSIDDLTIAEVSEGVVTALGEGHTNIQLHYRGGSYDIFDGLGPDSGFYKEHYTIPLTVIDGISLNMTTATIYTGSTLQLTLNTSNNSAPIEWVSSDESILTVDEDGLVKGIKEGNAVVTVTQTINGVTKKAICRIRVVGSVESITLDPVEKDVAIGDLLTINAIVTPKLNQVSLHWVTSNASIVSIEQAGDLSTTVKAVAGGTAVITAINQNNIVVGSCLIRVKQPIVSITLSQTNVTVPLTSKDFMLYATISPEAAKNEPVVWKSTDPTIATVDQFGKVTVKKPGKTSIICSSKADGNISAVCNVVVTKAVKGIKLDKTVLNMFAGETYRMTYVINPSDASDVAVTWMSTNPAVATVDAKGLVSAKSVGQTSIILKTADGGYMSTCLVNVSKVAAAVKLDITTLTLNVGDYYYFEATITPADSTETTLIWETSDKSVAIVSNKGKVTAKKAGVAIIMAKTKSGSTAYCTVTVQQGVTAVELDSNEETIRVDDVIELVAEIKPATATIQKVVWTSSNSSVASVDERGRVTGKREGVAIITCTSVDGGYVDYCAVVVLPKEIEIIDMKLVPETYKLGVGKTYKLGVEVTPADATNLEFEWSSSNPKVVTVDQKGKMKGISIGNAVITCKATDGSGAEAYCEVEVCYQITDIALNYDYLQLVVGHSETLKATLKPENATYGVTWESDDPSIAVVNGQTGKVTAIKAGDAKITARAQDSSGLTTICYVHVIDPIPVTNIQVSESEIVMIPNESTTVSFTILPAGHTDSYTWSSDNPAVASVNSRTGLITAHAMGTANITIFADSGKSASIKVYVVGLSKTSLTLEQYSSTLISLEVFGASKSDLSVRWLSENERIAEVAGGMITGRAIGTTTVYAVVNGRRLSCRVTVEKIGK